MLTEVKIKNPLELPQGSQEGLQKGLKVDLPYPFGPVTKLLCSFQSTLEQI